MDVLIFMGQSNMQGSTGEKCFEKSEKGVFEYKFLTDKIEPLIPPTGEDISGATGEVLLAAAALGNGSLLPYFCNAYFKSRGENVAVHTAKGNTCIAEWEKGTERFSVAVEKNKAAIKKAEESGRVDKIFVIWLQGESDALLFTSADEYCRKLIKLKNDLKREFYFDKFCIIKTGYFAAYAPWINAPIEEKRKSDESIMAAQDAVTKLDSDFVMLTDVTVGLSENPDYLNAEEHGPHYNNAGMKIIGEAAAFKLASIVKNL